MSIMNLIKMQIPTGYSVDLFLLFSWFGDYRSLRFLCVYFGRRTFLFTRCFYEKTETFYIYLNSFFRLLYGCGFFWVR